MKDDSSDHTTRAFPVVWWPGFMVVTPSFMQLSITFNNQRFSNCSPTVDVGCVKLTLDSFCGNRVFKINIRFCCHLCCNSFVILRNTPSQWTRKTFLPSNTGFYKYFIYYVAFFKFLYVGLFQKPTAKLGVLLSTSHIALSQTTNIHHNEIPIKYKLNFNKIYGRASVSRSLTNIKRKTCDIRTWRKHLFLDISSANIDTLAL
jgi:hypothetical protein